MTAPARPARQTTWNGTEQVDGHPPGSLVKTRDVETEATVVNVEPPAGRRENVAVWLLEVVGQFETTSLTHVYVPRSVTRSLYWTVETDRGTRDFVSQNLQENAVWLSDTHLLLLDVDGNRFEILDVTALDSKSRAYVTSIL